jgi:hypothetical protein
MLARSETDLYNTIFLVVPVVVFKKLLFSYEVAVTFLI